MNKLCYNQTSYTPIIKYAIKLKLKAIKSLENINIFTMPTRIKNQDLTAMFSGLISLVREKVRQEQVEKYLRLKLKYDRLHKQYCKLKTTLQTH